tara:strand:- start:1840 stop:3180 length:1341 start_codon:yes stop_codon:yes gene_type:complete
MKNIFKKFILLHLSILMGYSVIAFAETESDISASSFDQLKGLFPIILEENYIDFIRISIVNQPEYLFAVSTVEEKNMSLKYARRERLPELNFQLINDTSIDRDIDDLTSIRKRRDDSFDATVELSQPIYTGGSINAKIGIARNEFSMSRLMREESLSNQILRANEVYLLAAASDILYNYGLQILDDARPYLEKVRERAQLGIIDPVALAIFSIKFNNLESKVQILRTNRNRDVGVYEFFFKEEFQTASLPEVRIPLINSSDSKNGYMVENSLLDYQVKKQETRLTRSEYLPQFGIRTRVTQYDIDDDQNDTDIRGGIYFSMPVFTFGRASAKISSSRAKEKASQINIDVERKNDAELETEIVNLIDSSFNTRLDIFNSFNDTKKQRQIIKERIEITDFSVDSYIDSGLEELNQLERFLSTEISLLHSYMMYLHQNRDLTSFIRISP